MENFTSFYEMTEEDVTIPDGDSGMDSSISRSDLIEILILASIAIVGIIGNILVVAVYSKAKGQQTNAALYIINLAAADLITLGVIAVLEISEIFKITWPILWRYDIQCQLYRTGRFLCLDITVFLMMAIAIDRYIAVVHTLRYKVTCTTKRTKRLLVVTWIVALLLATPIGINFMTVFGKVARGPAHGVCGIKHIYTFNGLNYMGIYIALVLMLIPAFTTGVIYTVLVIYVRNHNAGFATQSSDPGNNRVRNNHWRMAKILMAVYLGYVLFYLPYFLFYFTEYVTGRLPQLVRQIFLEVPYGNSCVNPIIYLTMNKNFKAMLCKRFGCRLDGIEERRPVDNSGSSSIYNGSRQFDQINTDTTCSTVSSDNIVVTSHSSHSL